MTTVPAADADQTTTRPRAHWMDAVRGLAVLLVVLTHTYTMPQVLDAEFQSKTLAGIVQFFHSFRMPILLFLSGVLLPRSVAKPLAVYYRGKAEKILWPYLVWTVVVALALWRPQSLLKPEYWVGGTWHLWFLWVLLACYLVGPITRWVPAWAVAGTFVALLLILEDTPKDLHRILYWGVFFFLGAAFGRLLSHIKEMHWSLVLLSGAWTAVAVWAHMAGHYSMGTLRPVTLLAGLGGIVFGLWVAQRLPRIPFLEFCGRRSIVLYVAHMPVLMIACRLLEDVASIRPIDFYLWMASATFLVPLLLATVYPAVRWLFEFPSTKTRPMPALPATGGPFPRRRNALVPRRAA